LVDGVDRFAFAGTAAKNKNARHELKTRIRGVVLALRLTVFTKNDTRDANGLSTVPAKHSSKLGGLSNGGGH
jgi:hypothetical protein